MTDVTIESGEIVVRKTTATKSDKPAKWYRYTAEEFDALLRLAKKKGIDVGSKVKDNKAVNLITAAVLDDFLATQSKPKEK